MKALDFNMPQEIQFDIERGITQFRDSRLVILDANALGLLRQNLIEELGLEAARRFFFRFGYQNGYSDFIQAKVSYQFDNELELFKTGPALHSWEGKVKSSPLIIEFDRLKKEFHYESIWTNSYEAEQHLSYNETSTEPMCWSAMGYASGWSTQFFGSRVLCIEQQCVAKGDAVCRVLMKPVAYWGELARPYLDALQDIEY